MKYKYPSILKSITMPAISYQAHAVPLIYYKLHSSYSETKITYMCTPFTCLLYDSIHLLYSPTRICPNVSRSVLCSNYRSITTCSSWTAVTISPGWYSRELSTNGRDMWHRHKHCDCDNVKDATYRTFSRLCNAMSLQLHFYYYL